MVPGAYGPVLNPEADFRALGGLHDAEIERLDWCRDSLAIVVDDVNANTSGLPGYLGAWRAAVAFIDVEACRVEFDQQLDDCLTIYRLTASSGAGTFYVDIQLWPAGSIGITCRTIEMRAVEQGRL
jgi:hypothetical protein